MTFDWHSANIRKQEAAFMTWLREWQVEQMPFRMVINFDEQLNTLGISYLENPSAKVTNKFRIELREFKADDNYNQYSIYATGSDPDKDRNKIVLVNEHFTTELFEQFSAALHNFLIAYKLKTLESALFVMASIYIIETDWSRGKRGNTYILTPSDLNNKNPLITLNDLLSLPYDHNPFLKGGPEPRFGIELLRSNLEENSERINRYNLYPPLWLGNLPDPSGNTVTIVNHEQPKELPDPAENSSLQRATTKEPTDNESLDEQYVFRKEGEIWKIVYNGTSNNYKDIKGLNHICYLLKHKKENISVKGLMIDLGKHEVDNIDKSKSLSIGVLKDEELSNQGMHLSSFPNEAIDLSDDKMLESLPVELQKLWKNYRIAELSNDEEKMEEILEDIKQLKLYKKSQTNIKGQPRKVGSDFERNRQLVQKHIKLAFNNINKHDKALASHLITSIKTGSICIYNPTEDIDWNF